MSKVTHWTHLPTPVQHSRSLGTPPARRPPPLGNKADSHGRGASVLLVRGACGQEDRRKHPLHTVFGYSPWLWLGTDTKCDPGPCLPGPQAGGEGGGEQPLPASREPRSAQCRAEQPTSGR